MLFGVCVGITPSYNRTAAGVNLQRQARSSAVEHLLDTQVVGGSIPLAPTKPNPRTIGVMVCRALGSLFGERLGLYL